MKVLVTGGRNFNNKEFITKCLIAVDEKYGISAVLHGGCSGADHLAGVYAKCFGKQEIIMPADFKNNGKSGGPIRNKNMLDMVNPDAVVAFEGGRGTKGMVKLAKDAGFKVWETWK